MTRKSFGLRVIFRLAANGKSNYLFIYSSMLAAAILPAFIAFTLSLIHI